MAHAQHHLAETVYDTRPSDYRFGVLPDERIGAAARHVSPVRVAIRFVLAVGLSGAWTAVVCSPDFKTVLSVAQPAIASVIETVHALADRVRAAHSSPGVVAEMPAEMTPAPLPGQADSEMQPALAALPMVEGPSEPDAQPGAAASEPVGTDYTEKTEEAEDPAEKKERKKQAASAGLDPDLPNVLLSRLSKEDFKNAAYAIKTAIAKTADDAKFVWPLTPSRQQAKFEVHFVTGAEPGCRRYVVTVTKDRWSSTSAALERCGAAMARAG